MQLDRLIDALSSPAAYPYPVDSVEVRQTHISAVFLAGPFVYKVKKPVSLGFLDFSTLQRRRHFCDEEVRLNRRLAPSVYLGVVPVSRTAAGLRVEGGGEAVEWAVKMERLPDSASLLEWLRRGELAPDVVEELARRVAGFHAAAEGGARVAEFGRFEIVAGNARENFAQAAPQVGTTVSRFVFERLRALTDDHLTRLRPVLNARAARGVPRDTHGDLHLDHVYRFADRPPPGDLVAIDCIEFNERFRFADPVADMAFLAMDLAFHGRRDLARRFADAYFAAAGDDEGRALLPFYTAYRAAVRAKVEGFELAEAEIDAAERDAALVRARAHWLLALGELEAPAARPCLVLVGGLPGSGKSTLARALADAADFVVFRSDVVRKELAGLRPDARPGDELYTGEWDERTYAECLRRAEEMLFRGNRVLIDATFREECRRRLFLDAARRWAVPAALLVCRAAPEAIRGRLESRHGDASNADWGVYLKAAASWEEPGPEARTVLTAVSTDEGAEEVSARALGALRAAGLV